MHFFPRQLNTQLMLLVCCTLFASGALSGWLTAKRQSDMLVGSLREDASVMVRNYADTAAYYLVLNDYAGLESVLLKTAELPDIRALQVCEPDGALVIDVSREGTGRPVARYGRTYLAPPSIQAASAAIEGERLIVWQPIEAGKLMGWIRAVYSMKHIHDVQSVTLKSSLCIASLWAVGSSLMLLIIMRPGVLAFGRLTNFARELGEQRGVRINVASRIEEIEKMAASLNHASERICTAERDLIREREALREQHSTLRGIIDSADTLIFSVDRHYRYTSFNAAHAAVMLAIYGVEIQVGMSLLECMIVPMDRETAKQNIDRALAGERHVQSSYSGEDARSRLYFEVSHNPIHASDGSVIGVVVLSRDITERKRAEESLKKSEERYRHLFEAVPDAVVIADMQSGYIYDANPIAEILFGRSREELIGMHQSALHPARMAEQSKQSFIDRAAAVSKGGIAVPVEYVIQRADGTEVPVEVMTQPVTLAGKTMIQGVFRDISERKRTENELRRLNRELLALSKCNQTLLRASDELSLLRDICKIICDEAGYRMAWVGYAERDEERTVRPVAWSGAESGYLATVNITWSDTERGRGPTGRAIRNGTSVCSQDFMTDPNAAPWRENALQRGYRSSIALPLKNDLGAPFGALMIYAAEPHAFTDDEIRLLEELGGNLAFGVMVLRTRSERKRAEEELRKLNEDLELHVRERTEELEAMNEELRKVNRLFVGRELRMMELKSKMEKLEKAAGKLS